MPHANSADRSLVRTDATGSRRVWTVASFTLVASVIALVARRAGSETTATVAAAVIGALCGAVWAFGIRRRPPDPAGVMIEAIETIETTPFFVGLPVALKRCLAEGAQIETCRPGEKVVEEGVEADSCFVVRRGRLSVHVSDGPSNVRVAQLREGDLFGEMSLLTGEPRWATVIADDDAEVMRIHASALRKALIRSPGLLHELADTVAIRRDELLRARSLLERAAGGVDLPDAMRRFLQPSEGD